MQIRLVDEESEWAVDLQIDELTREAFLLQSLRATATDFRARFLERLAAHIPRMMFECLDSGLHPPTDKQMSFALGISRELGISIPSDAIRYKDAMSEFISRHVDLYNSRVYRQTPNAR
jgi:hypothetical protein